MPSHEPPSFDRPVSKVFGATDEVRVVTRTSSISTRSRVLRTGILFAVYALGLALATFEFGIDGNVSWVVGAMLYVVGSFFLRVQSLLGTVLAIAVTTFAPILLSAALATGMDHRSQQAKLADPGATFWGMVMEVPGAFLSLPIGVILYQFLARRARRSVGHDA